MNPETYYCPKCDGDNIIDLKTRLICGSYHPNEYIAVEFLCLDCLTLYETQFQAVDTSITSERNDK